MGRRIYTEDERQKKRSATAGRLWQEFRFLEDHAIEYSQYVPVVKEHLNVWSPRLANLICSTAAVFDSFSRAAVQQPEFDAISFDSLPGRMSMPIEEARGPRNRDLSIVHYRTMYETAYQEISSYRVLVLSPPEEPISLKPFGDLARQGPNGKTPRWWTNYNALKHDRFRLRGDGEDTLTIQKATLRTFFQCLAATFLVQLLVSSYQDYLVEAGVIRSNRGYSMRELCGILNGRQWRNEEARIAARSRLLGFVFPTQGIGETLTPDTAVSYEDDPQELFLFHNPEGYDRWHRAR